MSGLEFLIIILVSITLYIAVLNLVNWIFDQEGKMKKEIKYKSVSHTIKKDKDYSIICGYHICGCRMLHCTKCNKIFCPDCDSNFNHKKLTTCCLEAIDNYFNDSQKKYKERETIKKEMSKRIKTGKPKYKVKVVEILSNNKL